LNGIAILVRASFQMRAFEDRFIAIQLPYRVIGGPRFYERQEIKDAIAYLDVVHNPANDLKFERIVNVPKRGLGETAVRTIHQFARSAGEPLFRAARTLAQTEELKPQARKPLNALVQAFERWRGLLQTMHHTEVAQIILDESGYTAMWQNDKSPQAPTRLENLKELIHFMGEFDTLGAFLEHVALVMDADQASDGDRVGIMTLHAAKGLEFDTVFLPGWEEGLFPHQRSLDENGLAGLEEERRLAYVGITRARKRAFLSFAQNRRVHGLWQTALPSRFVDELPDAHVDAVQDSGAMGAYTRGPGFAEVWEGRVDGGYTSPGWQRAQTYYQQQAEQGPLDPHRRAAPTIEGELVASSSAESSGFEPGERIFHDKFGYGQIAEIDGNKLTVDFDKAGRKRVVASFVTRP
jgi:DNA helicase-2/ATP-dependent DNA helicase PcrA